MKVDKFKTYLIASGAEVLEPTNPYELVRFRTINGVSIVYQDKKGNVTFTNESQDAYDRMLHKTPWTIEPRGLVQKRYALMAIVKRDGIACFFCGKDTTDENRSIEHLLSVSRGGNNNPANLALACAPCNLAAGDMDIVAKIKYRETLRGK